MVPFVAFDDILQEQMMMYRSLSRRRFMQWAGLGTASLTLAACAVPPATEGASGEAMAEPVPLRIAHW